VIMTLLISAVATVAGVWIIVRRRLF